MGVDKMTMDSADLRVFEAVARLGGMSRAAAELHTVQSNVTTRIRLLEEKLGIPLFDRHSRGVTLTDAGRRLLPYAEDVASILDEAVRAAQDTGLPRGPLTLGSLETTAALRLSPVLTGFAQAYPDVDLVLRTGTTEEMAAAVIGRQIEGAFVCGPVEHPELISDVVFREELVIGAAPGIARLADIWQRPNLKMVILRAGCSYRQRLEEILAHRGIVGLRRLEFGTIESIVGSLAGGLGITLLPRSILAAGEREGRLSVHALPAAEAEVETIFIRRRDTRTSSAAEAFVTRAREIHGNRGTKNAPSVAAE